MYKKYRYYKYCKFMELCTYVFLTKNFTTICQKLDIEKFLNNSTI